MDHWVILLGVGVALAAWSLLRTLSQRPHRFWYYATLTVTSVVFVIMTPVMIGVFLGVLGRLIRPAYYGGYPEPLDIQAYLIGFGIVLAVGLLLSVRSASLSRYWKIAAVVEALALPLIVPLLGEPIIDALTKSMPLSFLNCLSLFYSEPHNAWSWSYFYSVWCDMTLVGKLNIVLLLGMMVYTFYLILSRAIRNREARNQSRVFGKEVARPLREWNIGDSISVAERYTLSPVSRVVASALTRFQEMLPLVPAPKAVEFAERSLTRSASALLAESRSGLAPLSTVSISAPLIGTFGTVVHIILGVFRGGPPPWHVAFYYLSQTLIPVALSLLIAIVAWWFHRHLSNEIDALEGEIEAGKVELVNHLIRFPKDALKIRIANEAAQ